MFADEVVCQATCIEDLGQFLRLRPVGQIGPSATCFVNTILLEHSHTICLVLFTAALCYNNRIIVTETISLT